MRAHSGHINDIAIAHHSLGTVLIASCGRDRTMQIFTKEASNLELLQTIEHHASSVNEVRFFDDGSTLLSLSSDRTVALHVMAIIDNSMAYILTRIITLKSTPISVTTERKDSMILIVSTIDKLVHKFDLSSGKQTHTTRGTDNESNESILLNHLTTKTIDVSESSLQLLLATSSTDKSIRIHDSTSGATIVKEYGHSEGISDLTVIKREGEQEDPLYTLVSTGLDGTIMLWDLKYSNIPSVDEPDPSTPLKDTPTITKPLRKVISRSALSEYHRSLEAKGISPLPLPSGRNQSPSRLRKRPSRFSLVNPSFDNLEPKLTLNLASAEVIPQPPQLPKTPTNNRQRPSFGERNRTKSANNLSSLGDIYDLNKAAEQLHKSLVAFRSKISAVSGQLNYNLAGDLVNELEVTKAAIQSWRSESHARHEGTTSGTRREGSRRGQAATESAVESLLGVYSDKLARMVEERVKSELSDQNLEETERDNSGRTSYEVVENIGRVMEREAVATVGEDLAATTSKGKG